MIFMLKLPSLVFSLIDADWVTKHILSIFFKIVKSRFFNELIYIHRLPFQQMVLNPSFQREGHLEVKLVRNQ